MQRERTVLYPDIESMKYTDTSRVSVRIVLRVRGKKLEVKVLLDCWMRMIKKANLTTGFGNKE